MSQLQKNILLSSKHYWQSITLDFAMSFPTSISANLQLKYFSPDVGFGKFLNSWGFFSPLEVTSESNQSTIV